jgi:hypothetical protein
MPSLVHLLFSRRRRYRFGLVGMKRRALAIVIFFALVHWGGYTSLDREGGLRETALFRAPERIVAGGEVGSARADEVAPRPERCAPITRGDGIVFHRSGTC